MLIIGKDAYLGWSTGIFVHNHRCKSKYVGKLPVSHLQLHGPGCRGSSLSRDAQTFIAPDTSPQLFWEDSELLHGQSIDVASPVYLGSSRVWNTALGNRPGVSRTDTWVTWTDSSQCKLAAALLQTLPEWLSFSPYQPYINHPQPSCGGKTLRLYHDLILFVITQSSLRVNQELHRGATSVAPICLLVSCSIFPLHVNRRP